MTFVTSPFRTVTPSRRWLPALLGLTAALLAGQPFLRAEGLSEEDNALIERVVREHMEKYDTPGLSLAIAKDGRLVVARGFGWADKEQKVRVEPKHRFRIASISKPITSIAIHKLVEMGRLKLDERVFGEGAILGRTYGSKPYSRAVEQITVRHLLEHAHGGWDNKNGDPMFQKPDFDHTQLIDWTLDERKLDREPGEGYSYSNFGYCLLGRIVEVRGGMPYAEVVREHVARPCGANSLEIGGDTLDDRKDNEVVYYGQEGADPYGMQVARMDAHGGWIASAPDLVRIAVRVDGFDSKPDLLSPTSIESMTEPSAAKSTYAKGWLVNEHDNWWHTGSIPGTRTIMVRTSHGFCWAALSNTRSRKPDHALDLDRTMWRIVRGVKQWPEGDLFAVPKQP